MGELGDFPEQVAVPVGWVCAHCDSEIGEDDRGRVIELESGAGRRTVAYH